MKTVHLNCSRIAKDKITKLTCLRLTNTSATSERFSLCVAKLRYRLYLFIAVTNLLHSWPIKHKGPQVYRHESKVRNWACGLCRNKLVVTRAADVWKFLWNRFLCELFQLICNVHKCGLLDSEIYVCWTTQNQVYYSLTTMVQHIVTISS